MHLRLGTRKSLLAWAQSSWVARLVEKRNPGVRVELIGIETAGDRILDISLRKVEGKEFFVGELDEALREGRVDFNVHSLKDLSLERPKEFVLAAVPEREDSRDVVILGPKAIEKAEKRARLVVGTSSPRRLENLPLPLKDFLPVGCEIHFEEIRGNINTRLSRVHLPESEAKSLDGVVLAAAGLNRLWNDLENGRPELEKLLKGTRLFWVPLSRSPSAPGQGALAIECRREDARTLAALKTLHDARTEADILEERSVLSREGGGCHQRFGASVERVGESGRVLTVRGLSSRVDAQGAPLRLEERTYFPVRELPKASRLKAWAPASDNANRVRSVEALELNAEQKALLKGAPFWILAHSAALTPALLECYNPKIQRVFAMGARSALEARNQGIWVEAHADGWGAEGLESIFLANGCEIDLGRDRGRS